MVQFFLDREENILGKGENDGYQHILLFFTMFSKHFFCSSISRPPMPFLHFEKKKKKFQKVSLSMSEGENLLVKNTVFHHK